MGVVVRIIPGCVKEGERKDESKQARKEGRKEGRAVSLTAITLTLLCVGVQGCF
jgi:hypothetical protein